MKKIYSYIVGVLLVILLIPMGNVKANSTYMITEGVVKLNKNIYIQPDKVENADVISIGSDIYVNGTVNGDVTSIGGNVYINGKVTGDATAIGGRVTKGSKGIIKGTIKERFKKSKIPFINSNKNIESTKFDHSRVASAILLFILCIITYNLMPYNEMRMASAIDKELGKSLIYGYGTIILIAMLLITLLFSIVGIILIPIVAIVFIITFLVGFTSMCLYVGKRFLKSKVSPMTSILVGVVFYEVIRSVVFLGLGHAVIILFIFPLSIGIPIRSKFGSFRPWRRLNTNDDWNDFWKH
ncbi:polymer-forming cytoskeletal protein [Clostridium sporogenes]|uniref:polymer-forming cytoskeletal protein n=1 Tax=Clostridium sporogenes TaxID=1509 RepID=UPI0013D449DE|nr:polymer-forming cytoskeletal protein [Clostridium sporogenes]MBU5301415.1 polymer-forming cytoskeletal protein [Clostridium sporogenes]NFP92370.1 polymer-forming cytoskeletal protein [Clostridium sporogenes]